MMMTGQIMDILCTFHFNIIELAKLAKNISKMPFNLYSVDF